MILVKGDDFITHDNSGHEKSVAEANAWLDHNTPDICYVENATHPLFLKEDRRLIKRVHDMGVPGDISTGTSTTDIPRCTAREKG